MLVLWQILFLNAVFGILSAQDVPAEVTQSLLVLLQEETTVRTRLEHDLMDLEKELNTLKVLQDNGTHFLHSIL